MPGVAECGGGAEGGGGGGGAAGGGGAVGVTKGGAGVSQYSSSTCRNKL